MKIHVENIKGLERALRTARSPEPEKVSVIVGYTAGRYALYVHEMTPKDPHWGRPRRKPHKGDYWDPPGRGQPKYLERPARELFNSGALARIVTKQVKGGNTLEDGLVMAGLEIMRHSQEIVPVDTGNLKASATVRTERDDAEHWNK